MIGNIYFWKNTKFCISAQIFIVFDILVDQSRFYPFFYQKMSQFQQYLAFVTPFIFIEIKLDWQYYTQSYHKNQVQPVQLSHQANDKIHHKAQLICTKKPYHYQYYNYHQLRIMKNYVEEVYQTSDSQSCHPQLGPHTLLYFSEAFHPFCNDNQPRTISYETSPKDHFQFRIDEEFVQRKDKNIVLQYKVGEKLISTKPISKSDKKEKFAFEKQPKKKPIQKQSRNVLSNILRIFFKSVLETRSFEILIQKAIQKMNINTTKQKFYAWLLSFNINFKNYIRTTQIKQILTALNSENHQQLFRVTFRHYLSTSAINHCLSSKKIESSSVKMHLSGLRELYQEAMNSRSLSK